MNTRFQSALNHIKADEALISKTEVYLRDKLTRNQENEIKKLFKPRFINIRNFAKAACIVFMLTGSTATYAFYKTPVSYLSLDINPSIEIGINAFNRVVTAEGYNSDGKTVLRGIDITGSNVADAVNTVITSAAKNGFIDNDGSTVVSLTSETNNAKAAGKLELEAETGVKKALKEKGKTAVVLKGNVSLAFRNEAREQNITPGKLKLIQEIQEVNPAATVDQYKDEKVKDIVNTIKDDQTASNKEASAVNSKNKNTANIEESISNKNDIDINSDKKSIIVNSNTESSSKKTVSSMNEGNGKIDNSDKKENSINKKQDESENSEKDTASNSEIAKRHTKNNKTKNK